MYSTVTYKIKKATGQARQWGIVAPTFILRRRMLHTAYNNTHSQSFRRSLTNGLLPTIQVVLIVSNQNAF